MAQQRVVAYYLHDNELTAAKAALANQQLTDSFVVGDIDETAIPALRDQGLIVEAFDARGEAETPGFPRATKLLLQLQSASPTSTRTAETNDVYRLRLSESLGDAWHADLVAQGAVVLDRIAPNQYTAQMTSGDVNDVTSLPFVDAVDRYTLADVEDLAVTEPAVNLASPDYYLVRLAGPLLEAWRMRMQGLGVELLEHVPPADYTALLNPQQTRAVEQLDFVVGVRVYTGQDTSPATVPAPSTTVTVSGRPLEMQAFDVRLHRQEDMAGVLSYLRDQHIDVAGTSDRRIRVYVLEGSTSPVDIGNLPAVASMDRYFSLEPHNDFARATLGIDQNGTESFVEDGDGQVIGVADSGLDDAHPDLRNRIHTVIARGRPGDTSDPAGHGTHVAGSIVGTGASSAGAIRGTAPGAKLFFQSLLKADGNFEFPVNLATLFDEAYRVGVRIHNDSWGAAKDDETLARYTMDSSDVDAFVAGHRDMLIVFSAGNAGRAKAPKHSKKGFVDWLSVGSPASAKNALTVGASRSARARGGLASSTWGDRWPDDFPEPPIAAERISGDARSIAAFSSRGPCDDTRIKPDVVAPGSNILSTKSAAAPIANFWASDAGNPRYAYLGGTSMAAPLVAGCAALVRQYFLTKRQHSPSAALLKATLVNGTRWLTGPDAIADYAECPNFHQGFGLVDLGRTLPSRARPRLSLLHVDTWQEGPEKQLKGTGAYRRFYVDAKNGEELRICLAFTDAPGRSLQNNLNLIVEDSSGNRLVGNSEMPLKLTEFDRVNNVEVVRIPSPSGKFLIQVQAATLLKPPQDFALVVTGEFAGGLVEG